MSALLAVALLLVLLIFLGRAGVTKKAQDFTLWFIRPLIRMTAINGFSTRTGKLSGEEVRALISENQQLRAGQVELKRLQSENDTLRRALSFRQDSGLSLKGVEVLLYGRESGREFLLIDAGKKDGIHEGDLVIDENRVFIGTVREVGETFAKVITVSSPGENIEVEILPSGVRVLSKGLGSRTLLLDLVPADALLRKGDVVLLASPRAKFHFPLGEIVRQALPTNAAFGQATALHLARPELLKEAFVVSSGER